ncbi:MAG: hypothetical protein P9L91_10830 [Candidatus Zophobacter franzmannii]|jgi:ketosteroid isomerase-like protein|nr:hypothetical protein [Candidatus Zophobacter franzmannii]
MKKLLIVLLVAVVLISCAKLTVQSIAKAPIDSLVADWCNGFNNHDAEAITNMFETDAILMDDNIIITNQQQMLHEWIDPNLSHVSNLKAEQLQAWSTSDRAGYAGKYSVDYTLDDGTVNHPKGVFMVNWTKNAEGEWKITTACINPF